MLLFHNFVILSHKDLVCHNCGFFLIIMIFMSIEVFSFYACQFVIFPGLGDPAYDIKQTLHVATVWFLLQHLSQALMQQRHLSIVYPQCSAAEKSFPADSTERSETPHTQWQGKDRQTRLNLIYRSCRRWKREKVLLNRSLFTLNEASDMHW